MQDRSYVRSGRRTHCFKAHKGTVEGTPYLTGVWDVPCAFILMAQQFTVDCLSLEGEGNTTSETSVTIHPIAQSNIPEDVNNHQYHCENLKYRTQRFIMR